MTHRVLIVDDNESLAGALAELLERRGFAPRTVYEAQAAIECLAAGAFDLLLLDFDLRGQSGAGLLREVRRRGFLLPAILITAREATEMRWALADQQVEILEKPISASALLELMSDILSRELRRAGGKVSTTLLLGFSVETRQALGVPRSTPLLEHAARPRRPRRLRGTS